MKETEFKDDEFFERPMSLRPRCEKKEGLEEKRGEK